MSASPEDDFRQLLEKNAAQLERREELGDAVATPRKVDHFAYFRSKKAARAAALELEARGYVIKGTKRRLFEVGLSFTCIAAVDEASAFSFCREIFDMVTKHGGTYDGWGGMVVEES